MRNSGDTRYVKKLTLAIIGIVDICCINAVAVELNWANAISGTIGEDYRYCGEPRRNVCIASDGDSVVYVAGCFRGMVDFDPDIG